jgi:uncharacterized membrane protein (DUF4010 family)
MEFPVLFGRFGLALAIGLLIGLQREYAKAPSGFAGTRTFALLSLFGAISGYLAELTASPWPLVAALGLVGGLVGLAYAFGAREGRYGLTTEVAAMVTFSVGVLCQRGELSLAAALGVATAVLLSLKLEVQRLVAHLSRKDLVATLKFAVITAIVLPLLPTHGFGTAPWNVVSPRNVWLMVVLLSGISFAGYVAVKFAGARRGIGLTGLFGGLVSSTAVTLGFAARSRQTPSLSMAFALAISLSWTVMFGRMLVEAGVINPPLLARAWFPIMAAGLVGLLFSWAILSRSPKTQEEMEFATPFELGPAVKFGLLYAAILVGARAAQLYLGDVGVYLASVVSGVADVDAITLSLARLSASGDVAVSIAARAVVFAAMANTMVKGGMVIALGSPALRRALLPGLLGMLAAGLGLSFAI